MSDTEKVKKGQKIDLPIEELLKPLVGRTVVVTLGGGQQIEARIDEVDNIRTAKVTVTKA